MRSGLMALLLVAAVGHGTVASAQQPITEQSCAAAQAEGVAQQAQGAMQAARAAFRRCATAACPSTLADACTRLYAEADAAVASITVLATDPNAQPTQQVRVLRDGELLATELGDGTIELDPGQHLLRFEFAGAPAVERSLLLKPGDKAKPISIIFGAAAAPTPPPPPLPVPVAPVPPLPAPAPDKPSEADAGPITAIWVGVALGGTGLLTGVVAGAVALARRDDIRQQCASGSCSEQDIAAGATPAHVATAGFALAGAGAATMLIGWIWQLDQDRAAAARPVVGLGYLGIAGQF